MMVAIWFTLITITQFHFMFYMSRTLPNIMALPLVLSAISSWMKGHSRNFIIYSGLAIIIFRFELAIFLGLLLANALYLKKTTINQLVQVAIPAGIIILSATVIVDSFFWQRPLWPEGQVLWYNTIMNKSANWGTSPFLWYFYSAIPRAMGFSLLFVPAGIVLEPRIRPLVLSAIAFVFLYSFLPHKELRFIIYIFPVLNLASACACHRLWINSGKSVWQGLLALIAGGHIVLNVVLTLFLLVVSSTNYPGGVALSRLHRIEAASNNVSVHVSNLAAQSGVSRFMEIRPDWSYDKTENLSFIETDMINYSHLLVEAKSKFNDDWTFLQENYETIEFIDCFSSIGIQYNSLLPVKVKTKPCIGIMKRKAGLMKQTKIEKSVESKPKVEKVEKMKKVEKVEEVKLAKTPTPKLEEVEKVEEIQEVVKKVEEIDEDLDEVAEVEDVDETEEDVTPPLKFAKTSEEKKFIAEEELPKKARQPTTPTQSPTIDEEDGVVISSGDSVEDANPTKEINFAELRNIALGKLTKSTRAKLREIIEQHYRSKGSMIENDPEPIEPKLLPGEKRKMTVRWIIRQERIKEMIEKISLMDLTKSCDLDKISTKDCLKKVIDEIDDKKK